ncbi:hypothetical protein AFLA_000243 [Aspergillus flavus NRRL3357]|nr:hypothetical protein AFLA_000243 [Aspergillus flavus NRRL3357]
MPPHTAEYPSFDEAGPTSIAEKKGFHDNVGSYDVENTAGQLEEVHDFKQGLHQRHIQMIALAGTIGTGLFLGSGRAIATAGPLGAFLGYSIIGLTVSSVVFGVGEMGALAPLTGGAIRYLDSSAILRCHLPLGGTMYTPTWYQFRPRLSQRPSLFSSG